MVFREGGHLLDRGRLLEGAFNSNLSVTEAFIREGAVIRSFTVL